MSESKKRRNNFLVRLIGAGLFAAVLSVVFWLVYREVHSQERNNAASHYGYERFTECLKESHSAPACRAHLQKSPYEKSSGYYDLKAQQEMAEWALIMLIITSVGIVFVAMTLKAATEANEGFGISAERQLRAYVGFKAGRFDQAIRSKTEQEVISGKITVTWINSGSTPAMRVKTWLSADTFEVGQTPEDIGFADLGKFNSKMPPIGPKGELSTYVELSLEKMKLAWSGDRQLFIWGWVEFTSINPEIRHRTEICANFHFNCDPAILYAPNDFPPTFTYTTAFNAMDEDCVHKPKT